MANLTPTAGWDDVFQLEKETPVLGGAGGVANRQAQELANRTEFLKNRTGKFVRIDSFGSIATTSAAYATVQAAFNSAMANGHNLLLPANTTLDIGAESFPWRQQVLGGALLDCKNIVIAGEGRTSIFKTSSPTGADVFQLNGVKNIHFYNLGITATLSTSSGSGSNGISITGGFDNITGDTLYIYDLPRVDKSTYIDGSKAITLQSDAATLGVGTATFTNIYAVRCAQGVGVEIGLNNFADEKFNVSVDIVAEDCYAAVSVSAPEATASLSVNNYNPVKVVATAINCQYDLIGNRAYGLDADITVVTHKTKTARTLAPDANPWIATDTSVTAANILGCKHSRLSVKGNKGDCDKKIAIGGVSSGSAGHSGSTSDCAMDFCLSGTAASADISVVDFGGNYVDNCWINLSKSTTSTLPTSLLVVANNNTVVIDGKMNVPSLSLRGDVSFYQTSAGSVKTGGVLLSGSVTALQGTATSGANSPVAGIADNSGVVRLGVVNGTGIAIDQLGSTSALGSYIGKHPVYKISDGSFLGWAPLYN